MAKRDHIHKLKLHRYKNGTQVFFCIDDCDYRIGRELALGKLTRCHRCGNPFQLNQYSLSLVKPHCEACHIRKGDKKILARRVTDDFVRPKPLVESIIVESARKIEGDLGSRLDSAIKSPVQMLDEKDFEL